MSEIEDAVDAERKRIVEFLRAVYEYSTHGASHLFEDAIIAVEKNDMADPIAVAKPSYGPPTRRQW